MDINLARTFLAIAETRHFGRAAERLHVTQTAVSARVRTLEELIGAALFVRNKAGAALTPAGQRFMRHARTLVQVWESARVQAAVPAGRRGVVTVGCEMSLWDPLLLDWLVRMRKAAPSSSVGPSAESSRKPLLRDCSTERHCSIGASTLIDPNANRFAPE